jgi:hypothetical protein
MSVGDLRLGLHGSAFLADRKNSPRLRQRQRVGPWRERPRDLTISAIMPAATAEVAHATLEGCHRRYTTVRSWWLFGGRPVRFSERLPPWFSYSPWETADAARGAGTKSGGWRSSGALSCSSKAVVDEPISVRASLASLSPPTTCKLRGRTTSAAFSAAHETHLAGVTDAAGA